jgi:tetratricopeptide (TPR) repeat protein
MNQPFNPVFAFKRLFGKEDASRVTSQLICHPIIWESLYKESFYLRIVDLFGSETEKWTPRNICLSVAETREVNAISLNQEDDRSTYSIEDQLLDIYESVIKVTDQKRALDSWDEIFEKLQLSEIKEDELFRKWGTVFTISTSSDSEKKELVDALVRNNTNKINLLSFLIHCSTDQNNIDDFIIRNKECIIDNPYILRELIFKLDKIGEHNKAEILVKTFLDYPNILKNEVVGDNSTISFNNKLEELKKINELCILSSFVNDKEKSQFYRDLAKELIIQSMYINPLKLYTQDLGIDDKELFSIENYISIKQNRYDKAHSLDNHNLKDIFSAFSLLSSNEGAAREICKRFLNNTKNQGVEREIFSPEFGYLIDPIDIAKLFIKLRLERDAVLLLEEILNSHPKNNQILKFLAHYSRTFGDHRRAVKYYSTLFTKNNILREEKIQFCKSLQYLDMWQDAFTVQKTINILNLNDKLEYANSAFRAEEKEEFQNEIEEIISNSPNNKTAQVLKAQFLQGNSEKLLSDTLIAKVISESNKDVSTVKLIVEYLRKNEEIEKLKLFLEGLPTKYQNHPEIAFLNAKAKKSIGKIQEYKDILQRLSGTTGIIKQEVMEGILFELIDNNMFNNAEIFLQTYEDKWVLSPKIAQAKVKVYLEAREFRKAESIISSMTADNLINEDIIIAYGCLLIKTSLSDFPYVRQINELSKIEKNRFQELVSRFDNQKSSLLLRMMQIEIENGEKEIDYTNLLSEKAFNNSIENWRIPFGLGNLHFRKNNFDQSIIYLKEALKIKPTHPVILDLLIQSYSRLKLPSEAIKLIKQQRNVNNLSLRKILKYSDLLFENHEFISLLESAVKDDKFKYMFSITKAKSLINKNNYKEAGNCLSEIEKEKNLDTDNLLIIAQYYIYCGSRLSARRVMEKYLSLKEDLSKINIIESASIYYQLNDYKKALHLVNLYKKRSPYISFIKTDILLQQKEIELAGEAIDEAIYLIENKEITTIQYNNFVVSIPESWKRDISELYLLLILLKTKKGKFANAFDLAKKGIIKFPSKTNIKELTFKLAYILGDKKFIDEGFKKNSVSQIICNEKEVLLEAENALENEEEVFLAKLIAEFNNQNKTNTHLATIQARLLYRSNNQPEANAIYLTILNQIQSDELPHEVSSIEDINRIIQYLAICDTAYELDDLSTALEISKKIISNFGLTFRVAKNYVKILARMLERNRLNERLLIKNHNFRILEDDLKILEDIAKYEKMEFGGLQEWIDRSMAVLSEENAYHEEVIKLSRNDENIGAIIFSLISMGRKTDAHSALALMDDNMEALFTYAVLMKDIELDKSKSIMLQILQKGDPKPEYYMALSVINELLGQLSDSYSAICLALDKWPEEYEWENIAGNLCKNLGNNRAAYAHFRNAEMYDPKNRYTNQIVNISTESGRLLSIKELEKQLNGTSKDFPIFIKIADALIEKERLNDAIYFVEKASAIQPDNNEINIIYGKIAYRKGNFEESQKIIDTVLNHNPSNFEAIKLKAMIIKELENVDSAISFLDGFSKGGLDNEEVIIIQKADFIKERDGIDAAIIFLTDKNELLENTNLLISTAKLYKLNGDLINALHFAEKALSKDSENSDLLYLLGGVSKDLGDLDKAIDYLFKSITIDPFDGKKYVSLSKLFENRRDYERAIDILMEGLDILPKEYDLLRYTGILLYKQGKYKEANSILEKAMVINTVDNDLENIKQILENSLQIKMNQVRDTEV